jgi:hypothetical protein
VANRKNERARHEPQGEPAAKILQLQTTKLPNGGVLVDMTVNQQMKDLIEEAMKISGITDINKLFEHVVREAHRKLKWKSRRRK